MINKIDSPTADPDSAIKEIEDIIGIEARTRCGSARKQGSVSTTARAYRREDPTAEGSEEAPLQALIIDSWFDSYAGVVSLVRVVNGVVRKNDKILALDEPEDEVERLGVFTPRPAARDELRRRGRVLIAAIREIDGAPVGDTIVEAKAQDVPALPASRRSSRAYSPGSSRLRPKLRELREALRKLALNDSSLSFEPEVSGALRVRHALRFLGLLHMEIIQSGSSASSTCR